MFTANVTRPARTAHHCLADAIARRGFLNALLREFKQWRTAPDGATLQLILGDGERITVPIVYWSRVGRHALGMPRDETGRALDINALAALVCRTPAFADTLPVAAERFCTDVGASATTLEAALAHGYQAFDRDFLASEQQLFAGHAVHPAPRARVGFSAADHQRYAPEFGGRFPLYWFAVAPTALWQSAAPGQNPQAAATALIASDPSLARLMERVPSGWTLLPAHPWQARRLLTHPRLQALLASDQLRACGEAGAPWAATSSVRTLYRRKAPWMLKFSLSARLTNSERVLTPSEVARGFSVHALLDAGLREQLSDIAPTLNIIGEPSALALDDGSGAPLAESFAVLRENPFHGDRGADVVLLASLCEPDVTPDGPPRLAQYVTEFATACAIPLKQAARLWFAKFVDILVVPLIQIAGQQGLLFSAHQQNTLLHLQTGLPVGAYYRDCQGTGYNQRHAEMLTATWPRFATETGNLLAPDTAAGLFGYYLFVNNVFAVIGALGEAGLIPETTLLNDLRQRLHTLTRTPTVCPAVLDHLLTAPTLWSKGNFLACLTRFDEAAAGAHRLVRYYDFPNPLNEETAA